jgi:hypothetical protein
VGPIKTGGEAFVRGVQGVGGVGGWFAHGLADIARGRQARFTGPWFSRPIWSELSYVKNENGSQFRGGL